MSYDFCFLFEVLARLFSPRKTALLLVIRDKTKVRTVPETEMHKFVVLFLYPDMLSWSDFCCALFCSSLQTPLEHLAQALKEDIQKVLMSYFLRTFLFPFVILQSSSFLLFIPDMGFCLQTRSLQGSCTK